MNWVIFWVLLGLALLNLTGVGLYHYQYAHETHQVAWYKDTKFWWMTAYLLVVGVTYVVIRGIAAVINKLRGRN